jgi:hypothetical protein
MRPLEERDLNKYIKDVNSMSITSLDQRVVRALCEDLLDRKKSNEPEYAGEMLVPEGNFMSLLQFLENEVIKEVKKSTLRSNSVDVDIKNLFEEFRYKLSKIRRDE